LKTGIPHKRVKVLQFIKSSHLPYAAMLVLGVVSLCGCFSSRVPIDLDPATIMPVIPAGREAPPAARPVSLVRPADARTNQNILVNANVGLLTRVDTFVAGNDPTVWVGNAFAAGLENAGYKVKRVDSIDAADTPAVVTISLTELTSGSRPGVSIHTSFSGVCPGNVVITVKLLKGSETLLDSGYHGESAQAGVCTDPTTLQSAEKKALEDVLAKAIPEIALKLRSID
jgi:hypothetical protein